jgi:hypothetical protein
VDPQRPHEDRSLGEGYPSCFCIDRGCVNSDEPAVLMLKREEHEACVRRAHLKMNLDHLGVLEQNASELKRNRSLPTAAAGCAEFVQAHSRGAQRCRARVSPRGRRARVGQRRAARARRELARRCGGAGARDRGRAVTAAGLVTAAEL